MSVILQLKEKSILIKKKQKTKTGDGCRESQALQPKFLLEIQLEDGAILWIRNTESGGDGISFKTLCWKIVQAHYRN